MKSIVIALTFFLTMVSCSLWKQKDTSGLMETQWQLVVNCEKLGVVSGTADAGYPICAYATRRMIKQVEKQALELGGTHIVWLHKTKTSAAADVYRCPSGK